VRPLLTALLALCLGAASGCIVWHSHLEPGAANFPASLQGTPKTPVRLNVEVARPAPRAADRTAKQRWTIDAEATARLAELINEAGIVSEAGTDLGLVEGTLRVVLREEGLGHPGFAVLTACTAGLIPYYGGKRWTATAELRGSRGLVSADFTAAAEARLVGHLFFLTGWNLDALNNLRDDALRGVVVKLAREQRRFLEASRSAATNVRTAKRR